MTPIQTRQSIIAYCNSLNSAEPTDVKLPSTDIERIAELGLSEVWRCHEQLNSGMSLLLPQRKADGISLQRGTWLDQSERSNVETTISSIILSREVDQVLSCDVNDAWKTRPATEMGLSNKTGCNKMLSRSTKPASLSKDLPKKLN